MWMSFMETALKDVPEQPLIPPENIITVKIDSETGLLASGNSKKTQYEFFVEGTEPQRSGSNSSSVSEASNEATNEELF
jgi:penicillin-binding protein 1A